MNQNPYPAQLGWNEWKSVSDSAGGYSMNNEQLYGILQGGVMGAGGAYNHVRLNSWGVDSDPYLPSYLSSRKETKEEKALLHQIHARAEHYMLRLLEDFAIA